MTRGGGKLLSWLITIWVNAQVWLEWWRQCIRLGSAFVIRNWFKLRRMSDWLWMVSYVYKAVRVISECWSTFGVISGDSWSDVVVVGLEGNESRFATFNGVHLFVFESRLYLLGLLRLSWLNLWVRSLLGGIYLEWWQVQVFACLLHNLAYLWMNVWHDWLVHNNVLFVGNASVDLFGQVYVFYVEWEKKKEKNGCLLQKLRRSISICAAGGTTNRRLKGIWEEAFLGYIHNMISVDGCDVQ